jgi:hypothetical protein
LATFSIFVHRFISFCDNFYFWGEKDRTDGLWEEGGEIGRGRVEGKAGARGLRREGGSRGKRDGRGRRREEGRWKPGGRRKEGGRREVGSTHVPNFFCRTVLQLVL